MACFARATGGKMFEAQTAAESSRPWARLCRRQHGAGTAGAAAKARIEGLAPKRECSVPLPTKPGLYLTTSLTANAEPLDIPVRWRVTPKSDADGLAAFQQEAAAPHLVAACRAL